MTGLVCGFGRCGSSAMCQAMAAAGLNVAGWYPSFELPEQTHRPDGDWILGYEGGVAKILEPAYNKPMEGPEYRVIWMDRDPVEQAHSWAKASRVWKKGGKPNWKLALKHMKKDRPRQIEAIKAISSVPPLMLTYEQLVSAPLPTILMIRDFLGVDVDVMSAVYSIHNRNAKCASVMVEQYMKPDRPLAVMPEITRKG